MEVLNQALVLLLSSHPRIEMLTCMLETKFRTITTSDPKQRKLSEEGQRFERRKKGMETEWKLQ